MTDAGGGSHTSDPCSNVLKKASAPSERDARCRVAVSGGQRCGSCCCWCSAWALAPADGSPGTGGCSGRCGTARGEDTRSQRRLGCAAWPGLAADAGLKRPLGAAAADGAGPATMAVAAAGAAPEQLPLAGRLPVGAAPAALAAAYGPADGGGAGCSGGTHGQLELAGRPTTAPGAGAFAGCTAGGGAAGGPSRQGLSRCISWRKRDDPDPGATLAADSVPVPESAAPCGVFWLCCLWCSWPGSSWWWGV
jgi:hypothetical protein